MAKEQRGQHWLGRRGQEITRGGRREEDEGGIGVTSSFCLCVGVSSLQVEIGIRNIPGVSSPADKPPAPSKRRAAPSPDWSRGAA